MTIANYIRVKTDTEKATPKIQYNTYRNQSGGGKYRKGVEGGGGTVGWFVLPTSLLLRYLKEEDEGVDGEGGCVLFFFLCSSYSGQSGFEHNFNRFARGFESANRECVNGY